MTQDAMITIMIWVMGFAVLLWIIEAITLAVLLLKEKMDNAWEKVEEGARQYNIRKAKEDEQERVEREARYEVKPELTDCSWYVA